VSEPRASRGPDQSQRETLKPSKSFDNADQQYFWSVGYATVNRRRRIKEKRETEALGQGEKHLTDKIGMDKILQQSIQKG